MSACAPAPFIGRLMFVKDIRSSTYFLLDSGAQVSVFAVNQQFVNSHNPSKFTLMTVNGLPIKTFGFTCLTVDIGLGKLFSWRFVLAQVNNSILGADFIRHFQIIIDMHNDRIAVNSKTDVNFPIVNTTVTAITPNFINLLNKFPSLTRPFDISSMVKHNITHVIPTTGPPVFAKPRRLPPDKLKIAKQEFDELLNLGFIRPSSSPWSSPLHLVRKANNSWRPCGDYRALNAATIPDRYPLPLLQDFTTNCFGCKYFSKIDLIKAYHQIPIAKEDIPKTAITTPFGLFEFTRMSFGLRNAAQSFQRFIDSILRGLSFCFAYLDDILVFSHDSKQHEIHLSIIFEKLTTYGIKVNASKCVFGQQQLEFLGHLISVSGISPLKSKVGDIVAFPRPAKRKQLQRFLGMVNFYHRFIKSCSDIMIPLVKLVVTSTEHKPLCWSQESNDAFTTIKSKLAECSLLCFPSHSGELSLMVDASDTAAGAVLQQKNSSGDFQPLSFFSKSFSLTERRYSTFGRELLAMYLAVKKFRYYLEGRKFVIFTDHRPIISAFASSADRFTGREHRHLIYISQFTSDIRFIPGSENKVADSLSRVEISSISNISLDQLHLAQKQDLELTDLLTNKVNTSLKLKQVLFPNSTRQIFADVSSHNKRPYIPKVLRKTVITNLHSLTHSGIRATKQLVTSRYVWPGINADIVKFVRSCLVCQANKVNKHTVSPVVQFTDPSQRFDVVHVDIIGPLPECKGFRYLLVCVDRFSRWPEAYPLVDITSVSVATAFLTGWISRFGIPSVMVTDRGRQFQSDIWRQFTQLFGIHHKSTTSYHPQCNGLVERLNKQIKDSLRMCDNPKDWVSHLPLILLGLRTVVKTSLGSTTAEYVYGCTLRLPGDFVSSKSNRDNVSDTTTISDFVVGLKHRMQQLSPARTRFTKRKSFIPQDLQSCSHVFVRHDAIRQPLCPRYDGPFTVVKRFKKYFIVLIKAKEETVSIDRLKPCFLPDEPELNSFSDSLSTNAFLKSCIRSPRRNSSLDEKLPRRVSFLLSPTVSFS